MKIYRSEQYIEPGHRIGVFACAHDAPQPPHTHEFIELVYIREGNAFHKIDGVAYELSRGDMLFIGCGSTHAYDASEGSSYVNICFSPEVMADAIITRENAPALLALCAFDEMRGEKNAGVVRFFGTERAEVEQTLSMMLSEQEGGLAYREKVIESCVSILFAKMLRKTEPHGTPSADGFWEELRAYIDENLSETLTLSALAKKSFYNPSYFSRRFRDKFGVSLTEYVGRRRILLAISLLSETSRSVDEIAALCGFSDRSSFYHAFARYTKSTPAEFRKRK